MNSRNVSEDEKIKKSINFDNLKSDYFLIKVFDTIKKKKSLEIMKYNKQLQKRLNISINDYKEYFQLHSFIELKIKFKDSITKDKFINISEEEKECIHIYFDDFGKGKKRKYAIFDDKVETIKIKINYQIKSFKNLFYRCDCIETIIFEKFNRKNITDMSNMFYGCSSLKEINLSNFNTDNVTDMSNMFSGCSELKEINLSNFNTDNVTDMSKMFCGCSELKKLRNF